MKINIIFAFENTCNVLCDSIIRSWKIMRYTRFIIMRSPVQSRVPLQRKIFRLLSGFHTWRSFFYFSHSAFIKKRTEITKSKESFRLSTNSLHPHIPTFFTFFVKRRTFILFFYKNYAYIVSRTSYIMKHAKEQNTLRILTRKSL